MVTRRQAQPWVAGSIRGCALAALAAVAFSLLALVLAYILRAEWLPSVGHALVLPSEVRRADVIVVLGGGNGDRPRYAGELYSQGLASHLIATGSPLGTEVGQTDLVKRGVPQQAIVLANGTQNTRDDALHSRELMQQNGWHSALLVTDPYHTRRSLWTFRTAFAGTSLEIWPAPVVGSWFDTDHWWETEDGFVAVDDEYLKLVYYVFHGYIQPAAITAR